MNRVLLLERSNNNAFDLSPAERYGALTVLFPRGLPVTPTNERFRQILLDRLDEIDYNEETDFVLVVGKLSKVCTSVAIMGATFDNVRLLVWSEFDREYRELKAYEPAA